MVVKLLLIVGAFLASVGTADAAGKGNWGFVSDRAELDRTWRGALVYLPQSAGGDGGYLLRHPEKLNTKLAGKMLPTIIYLHECFGLSYYRESLRNLSQLGFVVIAMDSFARSYRPIGCEEDFELRTDYEKLVIAFRKAELEYAIGQLKKLLWVDRNQLFLMGSGFGGQVVAQHQGDAFTGHVIEGWGCHSPHPDASGIRTPSSVPILAIVASKDRWYRDPDYKGDCGEFMAGRENSVSIVLDLPYHYVAWYPQARPALFRFLTRNMNTDQNEFANIPQIVEVSYDSITITPKWSVRAVYEAAKQHCTATNKRSFLVSAPPDTDRYKFVCE